MNRALSAAGVHNSKELRYVEPYGPIRTVRLKNRAQRPLNLKDTRVPSRDPHLTNNPQMSALGTVPPLATLKYSRGNSVHTPMELGGHACSTGIEREPSVTQNSVDVPRQKVQRHLSIRTPKAEREAYPARTTTLITKGGVCGLVNEMLTPMQQREVVRAVETGHLAPMPPAAEGHFHLLPLAILKVGKYGNSRLPGHREITALSHHARR